MRRCQHVDPRVLQVIRAGARGTRVLDRKRYQGWQKNKDSEYSLSRLLAELKCSQTTATPCKTKLAHTVNFLSYWLIGIKDLSSNSRLCPTREAAFLARGMSKTYIPSCSPHEAILSHRYSENIGGSESGTKTR